MDIFLKIFLYYLIFPLKLIISQFECEINAPILTAYGCKLQYCSKSQFVSGECSVNNTLIKTQWLNDIISFDLYRLRYGSLTVNSKGDLIFECSVEQENGIRVFYWLKKDGSYNFENSNGEKTPIKIIIVKNGNTYPLRYESRLISVIANK